jgi:hypothetical protein
MKTLFLTAAIIASLIPIGLTTTPIAAFATTDVDDDDPRRDPEDTSNAFGGGEKGLCEADEKIHEKRGFTGDTDENFHGQELDPLTLEDNPGGVDEGGFDVQDFLEECEHLQGDDD